MTQLNKLPLFAVGFFMSFSAYADNQNIDETAANLMIELAKTTPVIPQLHRYNKHNSTLSEKDKTRLNKMWHKQDKKLISKIQNNDLSQAISEILKKSKGLYSKVFITDKNGINVAQSPLNSEYWYGFKNEWTKAFLQENKKSYIDSGKNSKKLVSVPIKQNNLVIGVISFEVASNYE